MELREGGAVELVFDHDHLSVDDVPYPEAAIRSKAVTSRDPLFSIDPPLLLPLTLHGVYNRVPLFVLPPAPSRTLLVLPHPVLRLSSPPPFPPSLFPFPLSLLSFPLFFF